MFTVDCTLVGFRHHAWRGNSLGTRLATAQGQRVVLMRDCDNHRNREATVAYIDTEVVAYVTNDECHRMAAYLDSSEYGVLYGIITSVDVSYYRCTACIEVENKLEIPPVVENTEFDSWDSRWNNLPMPHLNDDELQLHMLQRHLVCMLSRIHSATPTLCCELDKYIQLTRYDISREASLNRRQIANLLHTDSDKTLRDYGQRMEVAITQMGDNEVCKDVARHICKSFAQSDSFAEMARGMSIADTGRMEEALRCFPCALHNEYRISVADFVSRSYYLHIPRQALRRFISCELLFAHLTLQTGANGINARTIQAVKNYTERISNYATAVWKTRTESLWEAIIDTFPNRITKLNGARDTLFSARFICMVVGRLIECGVYDKNVTQTEYGHILSLNGRDMRSSINKGLSDDKNVRESVDRIVSETLPQPKADTPAYAKKLF